MVPGNGDGIDRGLIVTTSWDDGSYLDLRLSSLLEKYGIKGTFYIAPYYTFRDRSLTENEILLLSKRGEIGAHTLTHPLLNIISVEKAKEEICGSKEYLEQLIGDPVKMFCYPYGLYNKTIVQIVKDAGFCGARTCSFRNYSCGFDPYRMPVTTIASRNPRLTGLQLCFNYQLSINSLMNWDERAIDIFDLALKDGGIFHIYSHSSDIERYRDWERLEKVLKHISGRPGVRYLTNSEVTETLSNDAFKS